MLIKFFFSKIDKKWADNFTKFVFWETFKNVKGYNINTLKGNAISWKIKRVKINATTALTNGKI